MGCFSCINPCDKDVRDYNEDLPPRSMDSSVDEKRKANTSCIVIQKKGGSTRAKGGKEKNPPKGNAARSFTFKELALATQNFRDINLIGEGGFRSVSKGRLESGLICFSEIEKNIIMDQPKNEGVRGRRDGMIFSLLLCLP